MKCKKRIYQVKLEMQHLTVMQVVTKLYRRNHTDANSHTLDLCK